MLQADGVAEAIGIASCHPKSNTMNEQIVRRHKSDAEILPINA